MHMHPSELDSLLQKFLEDTISEAELDALRRHFADEGAASQQEAAIEAVLWKARFTDVLPGSKEEAFAQVMQAAREREATPPTVVRPLRRWWPAAAAVAILLGAGIWMTTQRSQRQQDAVADTRSGDGIHPGREGAILTLADGTEVVLDSMQNGVVTTQGATTLMLQNGRLSYDEKHDAGKSADAYNTIATPPGRQFQIVLPDGTKIWLNAASTLRYPVAFRGGERKVKVEGEAYLEVAADAARPFIVDVAGGTEIQVLGTSFNINAYKDEKVQRTTLLQGRVRVKAAGGERILDPGQEAVADGQLSVNNNANLAQAVAWKNGVFHFENASLETVMRQLSRWYDVEVVYEKQVPALTFGGEMGRNLELKDVLEFLEGSGVHFRIEGRKLIVSP